MTTVKEDWDSYLCSVNDKPASIYVNLALKDIAPDRQRPILLIVWLYLLNPNPENGLSTQAEFDTLVAIEDALTPVIEREYSAIYPGRVTNDGRREFYFYSHKTENFEARVGQVLGKFEGYEFKAWTAGNADWDQYLNLLYPSASARRWIDDRRVVTLLESHGDKLSIERPIDHWAYFSSNEAREKFEQQIVSLGFNTQDKLVNDDKDMEYAIVFRKTQAAQLDAIHQTTTALELAASTCQGQYDGWESPVTTEVIKRAWWKFWKKQEK